MARKELIRILRDPMTLFFTLVIPIVELFVLGYAIDTNVRHVRTGQLVPASSVFDAARGVSLRGAGHGDLWLHALELWAMALATLAVSSLKFRKQIA